MLSRNFCQKIARVNFWTFYTVFTWQGLYQRPFQMISWPQWPQLFHSSSHLALLNVLHLKLWEQNSVIFTLCKYLQIFTDLGSLIRNTQCGNFRIFLLLRFYVKSILINFKARKLPFWPFRQLWILNFWESLTFSKVKFSQKLKFNTSKAVKMAIFDLLKSAKIDFT